MLILSLKLLPFRTNTILAIRKIFVNPLEIMRMFNF